VTLLRDETVDFVPLDLALCSWAYAWLAHAGPEAPLLRGITEAASRRLRDFSSQQLANMLWGLDHSNYKDDAFYVQVARWCCQLPRSFWTQAAGEEMVSILTALKPYGEQERGWKDLEALFESIVLEPLAKFLSQENSSEGYAQGLRQLRVYHAGTLYTERLLQRLGITYLGNGDDPRTRAKMEDLLQFYLLPPEPRWLPDGYDDDDIQANRAAHRASLSAPDRVELDELVETASGKSFVDYLQGLSDSFSGMGYWAGQLEVVLMGRLFPNPCTCAILKDDKFSKGNYAILDVVGRVGPPPFFLLWNGKDHYDLLIAKPGASQDIMKVLKDSKADH